MTTAAIGLWVQGGEEWEGEENNGEVERAGREGREKGRLVFVHSRV